MGTQGAQFRCAQLVPEQAGRDRHRLEHLHGTAQTRVPPGSKSESATQPTWASVFRTQKSMLFKFALIMRFTALEPPPPTPTTCGRG